MYMASPSTKFLALAALFLVLLSTVHGSIYRTVVTTTETITDEEQELGSEEKRCRQELQKHSLGSCRSYLRQQREVIMSRSNQQRKEGDVPQQCCEQMQKVRDDCTCYVLRRMVEEEKEEEGQGQRGELLRRAQQIPSQCQIQTGRCRISSAI